MIRLAVAGAAGRMGRTILSLAAKDADFKIAAAFESAESSALKADIGTLIGRSPLGVSVDHSFEALSRADVLIDFTHPSTTGLYLNAVLKYKVPYVIGTTGLSAKDLQPIHRITAKIPI